MSNKTIKNRALDFVKYHNGFVVGLVLALFGGAVIMAASPEARNAVIGEEIITEQGIDNSQIINADLENFDPRMKIDNVTEDQTNYYVDYSFQTFGVEANEWQTVNRNAKMTVAKESLSGQDLGLYVQTRLADIAQNERAYLKQAQAAEIEKGLTQITRATQYTGLIGLVLDVKNAVLPGYDPVVKPAPVKLAQNIETPQPEEPEIITESESAQNATTTEEIAAAAPDNQTQTPKPAQTEQVPEIRPQGASAPNTAAQPAEPENDEQSQAEPESNASIASEISTPDVSATSTAER